MLSTACVVGTYQRKLEDIAALGAKITYAPFACQYVLPRRLELRSQGTRRIPNSPCRRSFSEALASIQFLRNIVQTIALVHAILIQYLCNIHALAVMYSADDIHH